MKKTNTSSKDLQNVNAANNQTLETINAATIPAPEENNNPVTAEITGDPDFPHVDNFPTLTEGAKFEVNGYKVSVTGREYLKEEKYPFTAWTARVTAPDGTTKDFSKVRNTAICNFCKASTGITHNGTGAASITKVLTDAELATEASRRSQQIAGLLARAAELAQKYGTTTADDEPTRYAAILDQLTKDNDTRKANADKARKANAERQARKETRDLQAQISKLIAEGNFAKAAELMQQKANANNNE